VSAKKKATCIAYPGDHVLRLKNVERKPRTALTICRIEPENNLELLIDGALRSTVTEYTIIGNWSYSDYSRSLRDRHSSNARLRLLDPIYDPIRLAEFRERCSHYLHGHSVGGTNPSLVEMLFYDCAILCFDVEFNRYTAGQGAFYFSTAEDLQRALDQPIDPNAADRQNLRSQYTAEAIADAYLNTILS
jgi:glycosyltransferase involved in cell wall biosynthesis